ncbi:MAG: DUF2795 domain-containing protein [Actinobacteria bacterium]|nr:DUF2795 domain-containing protein [Actinomycetota bacterium]
MRGSTTHSRRVDDQLSHEVAALTHGAPDEGRIERRRQEDVAPPGGHEGIQRGDIGPVVPGLDEHSLDLRASVAAAVADVTFPATSDVLRDAARHVGAADDVLRELDRLPSGRTYEAVGEIWRDAGGAVEPRS